MENKDEQAFEKWIKEFGEKDPHLYEQYKNVWKEACAYKKKEIDDWVGVVQSAVLVYEEQLDRYRGKYVESPPTPCPQESDANGR
jgi:predicted metal-dependent hydrolase